MSQPIRIPQSYGETTEWYIWHALFLCASDSLPGHLHNRMIDSHLFFVITLTAFFSIVVPSYALAYIVYALQ